LHLFDQRKQFSFSTNVSGIAEGGIFYNVQPGN
jgi:hypothetical protein